MYEFIAPFPITSDFAEEIMNHILAKNSFDEAKMETDLGEYPIFFDHRKMNKGTSYQYSIRVEKSGVYHELKTEKGKITLYLKASEKTIYESLNQILPKFGVIHFGKLKGEFESKEKTEKALQLIIDNHPELKRFESLIESKKDHRKIIKWESSSNGFYYTMSHWSNQTLDEEMIDELLFPMVHKMELSEKVVEAIRKENFSTMPI